MRQSDWDTPKLVVMSSNMVATQQDDQTTQAFVVVNTLPCCIQHTVYDSLSNMLQCVFGVQKQHTMILTHMSSAAT